MSDRKLHVGIVGLQAGHWASASHVPALRALSDTFEIAGVANTSRASSEAAASAAGIPTEADRASSGRSTGRRATSA
jgi:predicted dehydrogenase